MSNNVFPDVVDVNVISPLETTSRGGVGVPVFIQDQTTDPLDLFFLQNKVTGLTLGADTSTNQRVGT